MKNKVSTLAISRKAHFDFDREVDLERDLASDSTSSYEQTSFMIVEDDVATSKFIKHAIKKSVNNPVKIRSFNTADKACEYIYSLKEFNLPGPDVAIIDYILTSNNEGIWLCDLLKKRFPETHVILMLSFSSDQMREIIERSETKPLFIQKPFEVDTLKKFLFN